MLVWLAAGQASAQTTPASDAWKKDLTMYLFGASVDGTVGALGRTAVVEQSFSDILSHLEFGVMGAFRASKGRWQIATDFAYTGLGVTAQAPPADINIKTSWLDVTGGYAVKPGVTVLFGGRINRPKNEVAFKDPPRLQLEASKTWFDPEVGIVLTKPLSQKLSGRFRADIGGFGIGSDIAWQIIPRARLEGVAQSLGAVCVSRDQHGLRERRRPPEVHLRRGDVGPRHRLHVAFLAPG